MIDRPKLQAEATELEALLRRYAPTSPELEQSLLELEPLFRDVGNPDAFVDEDASVPCARFFGEGGFEPWPDVAEAYSRFYVTLKDLGDVHFPED
jgi:hypothetical protein